MKRRPRPNLIDLDSWDRKGAQDQDVDGGTLTPRCGEPGSYEQVKVRIAAIDAPANAQPFMGQLKESIARSRSPDEHRNEKARTMRAVLALGLLSGMCLCCRSS